MDPLEDDEWNPPKDEAWKREAKLQRDQEEKQKTIMRFVVAAVALLLLIFVSPRADIAILLAAGLVCIGVSLVAALLRNWKFSDTSLHLGVYLLMASLTVYLLIVLVFSVLTAFVPLILDAWAFIRSFF